MASVYKVNKGVNASVMFRGLKAQYIWWLGGGLVSLLLLFAILYIAGVPMLRCLVLIFALGVLLFKRVYKLSKKYGAHGLMKQMGKRRVPDVVVRRSRKIFME